MFERLKVWLSLPFAMPGPIALDFFERIGMLAVTAITPAKVFFLAIIAALGITFRNPLAVLWDKVLFGVINGLANSKIPFLRCEILYKLNRAFVDPGKWYTHFHFREFQQAGHFDSLDMADPCIAIAGFTERQLGYIERLPSSLKELYRQRMVAAIMYNATRSDRHEALAFGYRACDAPDRFFQEVDGALILFDGRGGMTLSAEATG